MNCDSLDNSLYLTDNHIYKNTIQTFDGLLFINGNSNIRHTKTCIYANINIKIELNYKKVSILKIKFRVQIPIY